MIEIASRLPEIYLKPGEVYLARTPALLKTVLGSCVGVTFWSSRIGVGALCHGVLPTRPADDREDSYRYVDFAISDLLRRIEVLGASRTELQVKVFGGADVLAVLDRGRRKLTVGQQNLQVALDTLQREGVTVTSYDTGGKLGRTIQFNTATGEVILRRIDGSKSAAAKVV